MKQFLLALFACLLSVAGCSLRGSDDGSCGDREGLFIQTDDDSYQVGKRATLTIENCTGQMLYIENDYGDTPPDYHLEKKVANGWELVDSRAGGLGNGYKKIGEAQTQKFTAFTKPEEYLVDSIPGTYRYVLFIYEGEGANRLPEEKRVSNTIEITE